MSTSMTENEYASLLDELDRLLNDPDVPMQAARVWSLLAEISRHDVPRAGASGSRLAPKARRPSRAH
jgi:hypothetical protein